MNRIRVVDVVIAIVVVVIIVAMVRFRGDCKRKGGRPLTGESGWVCLAPSVVVP
jgi:hypothetical protein